MSADRREVGQLQYLADRYLELASECALIIRKEYAGLVESTNRDSADRWEAPQSMNRGHYLMTLFGGHAASAAVRLATSDRLMNHDETGRTTPPSTYDRCVGYFNSNERMILGELEANYIYWLHVMLGDNIRHGENERKPRAATPSIRYLERQAFIESLTTLEMLPVLESIRDRLTVEAHKLP